MAGSSAAGAPTPLPRCPALLFAHRGAGVEEPENTLPSFLKALSVGATALETDAHLTRDGHVVLSHDPTGVRMAGEHGALRELTLAQVKQWDAGWGFIEARGRRPFAGQGYRVPLLEELLSAVPRVPINVDLKQDTPSMVDAVIRLLHRSGDAPRVRLTSFHPSVLREVRRRRYAGPLSFAPSSSGWGAIETRGEPSTS